MLIIASANIHEGSLAEVFDFRFYTEMVNGPGSPRVKGVSIACYTRKFKWLMKRIILI